MNLLFFDTLSTCSKRALLRRRGRYGNPYQYRPQRRLVLRLAYEFRMTETQVLEQLVKERNYFLNQTV